MRSVWDDSGVATLLPGVVPSHTRIVEEGGYGDGFLVAENIPRVVVNRTKCQKPPDIKSE